MLRQGAGQRVAMSLTFYGSAPCPGVEVQKPMFRLQVVVVYWSGGPKSRSGGALEHWSFRRVLPQMLGPPDQVSALIRGPFQVSGSRRSSRPIVDLGLCTRAHFDLGILSWLSPASLNLPRVQSSVLRSCSFVPRIILRTYSHMLAAAFVVPIPRPAHIAK